MADSDVDDRFVTLRGGLIIPAPAYLLLLDLEARGFTLTRDDMTLVVRPPERLTRQDCASIRRWKWHVLTLMAYCRRVDIDAHVFSDTAPATPTTDNRRTV